MHHPSETVYAVAAGADLYVFDDKGTAAGQATVCIGANLDVETFDIPSHVWEDIRADIIAHCKDNGGQVVETLTHGG